MILKNKFNNLKQSRALMPNIIHSLDAASLAVVLNLYFKDKDFNGNSLNKSFFAILDCFVTLCNKVKLLLQYLKSAYCIVYSNESYLIKFDNMFLSSIKSRFNQKDFEFNRKNEIFKVKFENK